MDFIAKEKTKTDETKSNILRKLKRLVTPNRSLIPLKFTMFFYGCSAFCMLPYLTLHMKAVGISVENIAIMYTGK